MLQSGLIFFYYYYFIIWLDADGVYTLYSEGCLVGLAEETDE